MLMRESVWPRAGATERSQVVDAEVDVVVIGGGVTGLTTALKLAERGKRVAVLEARRLGDGTTGRTTGKVSLLQGTKLSRMLDIQSERVVRSYVEANQIGVDWLTGFCEQHGVPAQRRESITFAADPGDRSKVEDEHRAAARLGLAVSWQDELDVPFPTYGATALAEQLQLDPAALVAALASEVDALGGSVHENSRVVAVSKIGRPSVRTEHGATVRCAQVVLATGTPILDRGLYFAKVEAHRSALLAFSHAAPVGAMLLSAGSPTRSLRDSGAGASLLLVGGAGHVVGRTRSENGLLDELRGWVAQHYPGAVETAAWSAQDYATHDGIPSVGRLPRGMGHVYLATGYDKWGLANGVASATRIASAILGEAPAWAEPMGRRVTRPAAAATMVRRNADVGIAAVTSLAAAKPKACTLARLCTHLGGVLQWNDLEQSWDCPLHGSRFDADGEVLDGPATRSLPHPPDRPLA
jgi:glycine/D-amino acid oxidase-like deaminating enzyme/nitrite reductase/ring-hydroxylating ferredoxin subunit